MDELNEDADVAENGEEKVNDNKGENGEDDVDLYGDLDNAAKNSDANANVLERFNKLFSPKKRIDDEEFSDHIASEQEEDVGLYDDLNTFENHLAAEELEAKVECLEEKCSNLDQQNAELKAELAKVNKVNLMLKRNISSIFKTAKAELERKERQLKDLQREHDSLIFRRGAANAKKQQASQLDLPGCQILKKDSVKGNLVTLENETECTFRMGNASVSFAMESSDFQKRRFRRLETAARDKKAAKPVANAVKENAIEPQGHPPSQRPPIVENLEDGEVSDSGAAEALPVVERRDTSRRRDEPRRRSRSPLPNKRKRSPSIERRLRNRPAERGPAVKPRQPRSPVKAANSSRYRNGDNFHFNSRQPNRR